MTLRNQTLSVLKTTGVNNDKQATNVNAETVYEQHLTSISQVMFGARLFRKLDCTSLRSLLPQRRFSTVRNERLLIELLN